MNGHGPSHANGIQSSRPAERKHISPRDPLLGLAQGHHLKMALDTPFMLGNGNSTFANVLLTFAGTILMSL